MFLCDGPTDAVALALALEVAEADVVLDEAAVTVVAAYLMKSSKYGSDVLASVTLITRTWSPSASVPESKNSCPSCSDTSASWTDADENAVVCPPSIV